MLKQFEHHAESKTYMPIWAFISWIAMVVGFGGTWMAGRSRVGWLVGVGSSVLWLGYDVERGIWAGALAAVVAAALSVRNFRIGGERNR